MNKNLEQYFSASEIQTIQKFVAFVAAENQSNDSSFSTENDTDESVRAEVREWLEKRYARGHGKRRNN